MVYKVGKYFGKVLSIDFRRSSSLQILATESRKQIYMTRISSIFNKSVREFSKNLGAYVQTIMTINSHSIDNLLLQVIARERLSLVVSMK